MTPSRIARGASLAFATALALAACGGDADTTSTAADTVPVATTVLTSSDPAQSDTAQSDTAPADTAPADTAPSDTAPEAIASTDDRPATWDSSLPYGFGDDATFDALWTSCEGGDSEACTDLFFTSPADSAYEAFAIDRIDLSDVEDYADDLLDDLESGDNGSPLGSGNALEDALAMERPANWDAGTPFTYGDDETFDALWDACEAGDGDACDELFWTSPADSAYESYSLDKSLGG